MGLRKAAHFQPKPDKSHLLDDVLDMVRTNTFTLDAELPSLAKMTRRDLEILLAALNHETPERQS